MTIIEAHCLLWLLIAILSGVAAFGCFLRFDAGPGWVFNLWMPLAIVSKLFSLLFAISFIIKLLKYCFQ